MGTIRETEIQKSQRFSKITHNSAIISGSSHSVRYKGTIQKSNHDS